MGMMPVYNIRTSINQSSPSILPMRRRPGKHFRCRKSGYYNEISFIFQFSDLVINHRIESSHAWFIPLSNSKLDFAPC
ncbi:hypothetical protein BB931_04985 [Spiribacter salinus]|nr:hypothetical protein [Spiribacter salinus]